MAWCTLGMGKDPLLLQSQAASKIFAGFTPSSAKWEEISIYTCRPSPWQPG